MRRYLAPALMGLAGGVAAAFLFSDDPAPAPPRLLPTPRVEPAPAAPGKLFIGDSCQEDADCAYPGGICLGPEDGFAQKICSARCETHCPREDGTLVPSHPSPEPAPAFCVDASLFSPSGTGGLCLRVAAEERENGGCGNGEVPELFVRFPGQDRARKVCAPAIEPPPSCGEAEDEYIDFDYPDDGRIFIPREARCGGRFDLLVIFHGDQWTRYKPAPNIGAGNELDKIARGLIDAKKSRPVLLAEPVENDKTCTLYDEDGFSPGYYFSQLQRKLREKKIQISSLSIMGHSRGACCLEAGIYRMGRFFPGLKLWGKSDGCYRNPGFDAWPGQVLAKTETILFSVQNPDRLRRSGHLDAVVTEKPESIECSQEFSSCYKHPKRPWYSLQSDAFSHSELPKLFLREALSRFFTP